MSNYLRPAYYLKFHTGVSFYHQQTNNKEKRSKMINFENRSGVEFQKSADKKTSMHVNYLEESPVKICPRNK